MSQKPKPPSQSGRPAAERPFVDREESVAPVHAALKEPQRTAPLVLVCYGGPGIGKSRLRRELTKQMAEDPSVVTATLDFAVPSFRQPDSALFALRNSLGEGYNVRFPSFDLAYAYYWQKTHPDTALASGDMTGIAAIRALPEAGAGPPAHRVPKEAAAPDSLLSQLLDESGRLPLIGLIPKLSKLLVASLESSAPTPLDPFLTDWWTKRGERELEDLPQMEPGAIVECLPKLWAADLKDHLTAKTGTVPQRVGSSCSEGLSPTFAEPVPVRRAVLFIDAYEQLWQTGDGRPETEDSKQKTDEWMRELVKQLPEALWVICGRQKLRWEEVDQEWSKALSQNQLKALPDQSARQFLASCGIANEPIQDAIVKGSQGVPHYLDLAVDTIERTKDEGQRTKLTGDSPAELQKQFVRHLSRPELEALQILSAPRYWYYGLFENLMSEYETGYPASAYDDLARFSFVKDGAAPGTRTMHDLMREALQEAQSPELRKRVHLFLHELYTGQLKGLGAKDITEKHRTALTEAFYHGGQAMSAQELWAWFEQAAAVFDKASQARVLLPLYREMTQALETELGPNHPEVATALWRLGEQRRELAEYDEAEPLLRRALAIAETGQGPEHPHHCDFQRELAETLKRRGRLDEAEALLRRAVEAFDKKTDSDAETRVSALRGLTGVLTDQRKYAEAERLCRQALAICENELGPDHAIRADALNSLSHLLFEQDRHSEAESVIRRWLAIREKNWGANHPRTMSALAELAVNLESLGRYDEAEPLYRRALKLAEEDRGPGHDDTAVVRNNLANLLCMTGRHAEAEPLYRQALAAVKKRAGPDHPYAVRMTSNLAITLANVGKHVEAEQMALDLVADQEKKHGPDHPETATKLQLAGLVYERQNRCDKAEIYIRRALEIRTGVHGPEHPSTLGSLGGLARIEEKQGSHAEAERLYRDLLPKLERVHGKDHPNVAKVANRLAGICSRDGRYDEAEALYRRALAIRERSFGQDHPFAAEVLEGLAKVCEQTGRAAEAQELSTRAKRVRDQQTGSKDN